MPLLGTDFGLHPSCSVRHSSKSVSTFIDCFSSWLFLCLYFYVLGKQAAVIFKRYVSISIFVNLVSSVPHFRCNIPSVQCTIVRNRYFPTFLTIRGILFTFIWYGIQSSKLFLSARRSCFLSFSIVHRNDSRSGRDFVSKQRHIGEWKSLVLLSRTIGSCSLFLWGYRVSLFIRMSRAMSFLIVSSRSLAFSVAMQFYNARYPSSVLFHFISVPDGHPLSPMA